MAGRAAHVPITPVVALISSAGPLLKEARRALQVAVCGADAPSAFNHTVFEAPECAIEDVLMAAQTLPFMAPYRWVEIRHSDKLPKAALDALAAYAKDPAPKTVLVLVGEKADVRTKLYAQLKKARALHILEPPRGHDIVRHLQARAQLRDVTLTREAAQLLVACVGDDLGALEMATEQVLLYAGDAQTVTEQHVGEAVATSAKGVAFALTDVLLKESWAKAALTCRALLAQGESPLLMLALLARLVRQLLALQALPVQAPRAEQAKAAQVPPFAVEALWQRARRTSPAALCALHLKLTQADTAIKTGQTDAALMLQQVVWSFAEAWGPTRSASAPPTP